MHPVDSPIGIYGQLFPTSLRLLCPSPFSPCYSPILNVIPFSRFLSARRDAFSTLPLCWYEILFHSASFFIVMPVIWFRFAMTPSCDHFHSLFLHISWLSSFFFMEVGLRYHYIRLVLPISGISSFEILLNIFRRAVLAG